MGTDWIRLDFSVPRDMEDEATLSLHELGIPGWEVLDQTPDRVRLRFWALPEDAPELTQALTDIAGSAPETASPLTDDGWVDAWTPMRVGPFVIGSQGAPRPRVGPNEHMIRLAPALAFGGGEHPTTRLCLLALPERVRPGTAVLDVGCGSGILAVAASCLGADPVIACDIDPTARRATARAARATEVQVEVAEGLPGPGRRFDVVLANILAPTLVELAPALKARVRPAGRLLLSGIRAGSEGTVIEALRPLEVASLSQDEGWLLLELLAPL